MKRIMLSFLSSKMFFPDSWYNHSFLYFTHSLSYTVIEMENFCTFFGSDTKGHLPTDNFLGSKSRLEALPYITSAPYILSITVSISYYYYCCQFLILLIYGILLKSQLWESYACLIHHCTPRIGNVCLSWIYYTLMHPYSYLIFNFL